MAVVIEVALVVANSEVVKVAVVVNSGVEEDSKVVARTMAFEEGAAEEEAVHQGAVAVA